eukprot:snap_masked-scaffold_9-processed-gene-12.11-mRNA-1 protein AED:1.00 eAED:1.00 QI:0/0/0/0/1/1/2/0/71
MEPGLGNTKNLAIVLTTYTTEDGKRLDAARLDIWIRIFLLFKFISRLVSAPILTTAFFMKRLTPHDVNVLF